MANPPITIGPFTNVPAPGSPIKSDWPQQLTQYTVDLATEVRTLRGAAANTANQTVAGGGNFIRITLGTTTYDTDGFRAGGDATKFVIPAGLSGTYGIQVQLIITPAMVSTSWLRVLAGTYAGGFWSSMPSLVPRVHPSFIAHLLAGEEVTLDVAPIDPNPQNYAAAVWLTRLGP